ncbi:Aste57867_25353 [Aphanomyces stellatus]|uniref:Aste57867_25353 protein n=1 Tax=Aphanomyces stellatus TaxID=120398 RepID=A0A485LTL0_9STRA|nr:hypothetical protein As57867_025275 [Aphanomyces stellatus]VFU01978.1 Aste57867_25353 [Aphanomyces stellatus]
MGLLRTLPLLAGGTVATAAAAVAIATRHVRPTPLLTLDPSALISRFVSVPHQHVDVFEVSLDQPTSVTDVARAFFQSPVFQVERMVLNLAGAYVTTDAAIDSLPFAVGDSVVMFKVVDTTPNELLFKYSDKVNGHSWLAVSDDGRRLRFGSTIQNASLAVRLFTPIHLIYAQVVLASAKYELEKQAEL